MRIKIDLSDEFEQKCPEFRGKAVYAHVKNSAYSKGLWEEIEELTTVYRTRYTPDTVKEIAPIRATREAYRQCGKDPSRYRPSNEANSNRKKPSKPPQPVKVSVRAMPNPYPEKDSDEQEVPRPHSA